MLEKLRSIAKPALICLLLAPLALCGGCSQNAKLTVLISADTAGAQALLQQAATAANVNISDIGSLTVTVNSLTLDQLQGGQTELITTPQDVDLVALASTAGILAVAEAPAGIYTKVQLGVENPRLVLNSNPSTPVTGSQLPAIPQLSASTQLVAIPNANTNLLLTFSGSSTPLSLQIQATKPMQPVAVTSEGTVVSVDATANTMVLAISDANVTVDIAAAAIYLSGDTGTPTGTAASLTAGAVVAVEGSVNADGTIAATRLTV